jgi:adenosine deaminase
MSTIDFHSLAKTELHCHLDGSLSLPTIRQLAAMANIDLPASDEELKHHVSAPAHCENLLDYLEAFDYIRPLLQTKEADFYQHNVDAIQASFASDEEKQELLSKLEKAYADYL